MQTDTTGSHDADVATATDPVASVNGVALHLGGETPNVETLRQRAWMSRTFRLPTALSARPPAPPSTS